MNKGSGEERGSLHGEVQCIISTDVGVSPTGGKFWWILVLIQISMAGDTDTDADRKYDAMIDLNEEEQMWVINAIYSSHRVKALDNDRMALSAQRCIRIHLNKLITASFRVNLIIEGEGRKIPGSF